MTAGGKILRNMESASISPGGAGGGILIHTVNDVIREVFKVTGFINLLAI